MFLSYEEYTAKGGALDNSAFIKKINKAERMLNYWTLDRIPTSAIDIELIKDLLFEMVETINEGQEVTSFSNDGVSVSFNDETEEERLYNLVVMYLPVELVSTCVGGSYENKSK